VRCPPHAHDARARRVSGRGCSGLRDGPIFGLTWGRREPTLATPPRDAEAPATAERWPGLRRLRPRGSRSGRTGGDRNFSPPASLPSPRWWGCR
jgi:hypothetical protein